jgi:hypothetical protein
VATAGACGTRPAVQYTVTQSTARVNMFMLCSTLRLSCVMRKHIRLAEGRNEGRASAVGTVDRVLLEVGSPVHTQVTCTT